MADDLFFNDATLEAFRDMQNPKVARAKMIARAEAASVERQKVAAGLAGSALAAAGYEVPKPAKRTVDDLTESFKKLTPGQRRTISDALFTAEAAAGDSDDFPVSASEATAGFTDDGSYVAPEPDDEIEW